MSESTSLMTGVLLTRHTAVQANVLMLLCGSIERQIALALFLVRLMSAIRIGNHAGRYRHLCARCAVMRDALHVCFAAIGPLENICHCLSPFSVAPVNVTHLLYAGLGFVDPRMQPTLAAMRAAFSAPTARTKLPCLEIFHPA